MPQLGPEAGSRNQLQAGREDLIELLRHPHEGGAAGHLLQLRRADIGAGRAKPAGCENGTVGNVLFLCKVQQLA